jgi:hypothetical protein
LSKIAWLRREAAGIRSIPNYALCVAGRGAVAGLVSSRPRKQVKEIDTRNMSVSTVTG